MSKVLHQARNLPSVHACLGHEGVSTVSPLRESMHRQDQADLQRDLVEQHIVALF